MFDIDWKLTICKYQVDPLIWLARSLGFPDDHFETMFEPNPLSTFRIIHYPSRVNFTDVPDEARDGKTLITTGKIETDWQADKTQT